MMISIDTRDLICTMRQEIESLLAMKWPPSDTDIGLAIEQVIACGDKIQCDGHHRAPTCLDHDCWRGSAFPGMDPVRRDRNYSSSGVSESAQSDLESRAHDTLQASPVSNSLSATPATRSHVPIISQGDMIDRIGLAKWLEDRRLQPDPYADELATSTDLVRRAIILADHSYRQGWNNLIDLTIAMLALHKIEVPHGR